jgi:hypothetical protein
MRNLLLLAVLFATTLSQAQILNAESLRKVTDTSVFSGAASANFALKRNVYDFVTIGSDIHLQYKNNNPLALFKNDVNFQKIEGDKFENSLTSRARYNYNFQQRITWEALVQAQSNKVNLIAFREAVGTVPRFKITK